MQVFFTHLLCRSTKLICIRDRYTHMYVSDGIEGAYTPYNVGGSQHWYIRMYSTYNVCALFVGTYACTHIRT